MNFLLLTSFDFKLPTYECRLWLRVTHLWLNLIPTSCFGKWMTSNIKRLLIVERILQSFHKIKQKKKKHETKGEKLMMAICRFMGVVIEIIELPSSRVWLVMCLNAIRDVMQWSRAFLMMHWTWCCFQLWERKVLLKLFLPSSIPNHSSWIMIMWMIV